MLKKMHPKKLIGIAFEVMIVAVVAVFFAINSFRFWEWTFPPEQWYLAYLGFGLTGGAAVGYLFVFLWRAETSLRKTTALIMMLVCIVGELITAGFGIQVEIWKRAGYTLTQSDFDFMTLIVQGLGFVHAIAVIVYYVGDQIAAMFGDEDGDGIPNYRDRDYKPNKSSNNRPQNAPQRAQKPQNAPQQQQASQHTLSDFLRVTGLTREQAQAQYADRNAFMDFASGQFDYISGGNMKRIHGELMNGNFQKAGQR